MKHTEAKSLGVFFNSTFRVKSYFYQLFYEVKMFADI